MSYAKTTKVSTDQSEMQIKIMLRKHGALQIAFVEDEVRLGIQFVMNDRHIRFIVPFPKADDEDICFTETGKPRTQAQIKAALEQSMRQRYRLLFIIVKAKLEAVQTKVVSFEEEFLAHTVMADGATVGDYIIPKVTLMYETGTMPPLLSFDG
jgi:hypothetical protein